MGVFVGSLRHVFISRSMLKGEFSRLRVNDLDFRSPEMLGSVDWLLVTEVPEGHLGPTSRVF
jgi:hypothetical protein